MKGNSEQVYAKGDRDLKGLDSRLLYEMLHALPFNVKTVEIQIQVEDMSYRRRRTAVRNVDWSKAVSPETPQDREVTFSFAWHTGTVSLNRWPRSVRDIMFDFTRTVRCCFL